MLRYTTDSQLSELLPVMTADAFGTKCAGLCLAYPAGRGVVDAWTAMDGGGNLKSAVTQLDGCATVFSSPESDFAELAALIRMLGCVSVFSTAQCLEGIGLTGFSRGGVYTRKSEHGNADCFSSSEKETNEVSRDASRLREIYSLISECLPDSFGENGYLPFLSDFTYRNRRSLARAHYIVEDGIIVSCALTTSETPSAAIIGGVACHANSRKRGLGRKTVLSLADELIREGKTVYIFALNEGAQSFYERIGFTRCSEWGEAKLRQ